MKTDDAQRGIEWWNRLAETQREFWLQVADSATPADAWVAYQESVNTLVLYIYSASSGQWSGQLHMAGQWVFGVLACDSTDDVEQAVQDAGYDTYSLVYLGQTP
jgi:hypothetical protein